MKKLDIGEILKLDDNIDYVIIDKVNFKTKTYILFSNLDDPEDIMIRIEEISNDELLLKGLKDEIEFKKALKLFDEKLSIT